MKQRNAKKGFVLVLVALVMALVLVGTVLAGGSSHGKRRAQRSKAPVYWAWDFESGNEENPVGTSKLVRTRRGISANFKTKVLTPDSAVTLWFIVFNYPEECQAGPYMCSPHDLGDTPAQGDFFLASGHVIGGRGKGNFGGHLKVGDTRRSGLAETMDCEDCTPGLINPEGALVVLATHDHGPKLTGQALKEQLSTFLGDCDAGFIGNEFGFASGPDDLPIPAGGYCSTIQFSPHMP